MYLLNALAAVCLIARDLLWRFVPSLSPARVALIPGMLFLAACDAPWPLSPPASLDAAVLVDTTAVTLSDMASVQSSLREAASGAIASGKSVTLWVIDARKGARRVAGFTPTTPMSEAKKVKLLHHQEMMRDCDQVFGAVLPTIFGDAPTSSPLAAAILTIVTTHDGPLDLHVMSDMREASGVWNFEGRNRLPSAEEWAARLGKTGFAKESLTGVRLRIVRMPLVVNTDVEVSPKRGLEIRKLWQVLKTFGADAVVFDDAPPSHAFFFVVTGPFVHLWRRWRVWMKGRFHGKHGLAFSPRRTVEAHLSDKPNVDITNPKVEDALTTREEKRDEIKKLDADIKPLRSKIARQPRVIPRMLLIFLALLIDVFATGRIFLDQGQPSPECWLYGLGVGLLLIVLACLAGRAAAMEGKPPKWFYLVIGAIGLFSVSLTITRVLGAPATGDPLIGEIAKGLLQLAAVIGSPLIVEFVFAPIRNVLIDIKELWDLQKQHRQAKKAYDAAVRFLTDLALARQWWDHEFTKLSSVYEDAYVSAGGRIPPPGGDIPSGQVPSLPVSPSNGGLPQWPQ